MNKKGYWFTSVNFGSLKYFKDNQEITKAEYKEGTKR